LEGRFAREFDAIVAAEAVLRSSGEKFD